MSGQGFHTVFKFCDGTNSTTGANEDKGKFVDILVALSLSGLTGVRAFMPLFIVSVGRKVMGHDFFLCLSDDGELLDSPAFLIILGILTVLELVADLIPVVSEIEDVVMDFVKPVVGVFIATAPSYAPQDGGQPLGLDLTMAVPCGCISFAVALTKQLSTLTLDAASVGIASPLRSILEDILVLAFTFGMIFFITYISVIAIGGLVLNGLAVLYLVYKGCKWKAKKKMASRKEKKNAKTGSHKPGKEAVDEEDDSEEESEEEERVNIFYTCLFCIILRKLNKMRKKIASRRYADARTIKPLASPDPSEPLL